MNARNLTDFSATQHTVPAPGSDGLQAVDVTVEVAGKTLLKTVSAHFATGKVSAILGANGAGKSTLMSLLTGQRQPVAGQVCLAGQALPDYPQLVLARLRAFVAQETHVAFDFSVRDVVELGRYPHRRQPSAQEATIALQAMQATGVEHLALRALNTLSGGEKARVHLARALAQVWEPVERARWLLLDEPTAALDLQQQHLMLQWVRHWALTQGAGVVAVLHDLNLALRYSDHCVVLQGGLVVASGATAEVLTPDCIAQVWGVRACAVTVQSASATAPGELQYIFDAAPL